MQPLENITTADQARQHAIDWQDWQAEQSLSYSEVLQWSQYFTILAEQWPELKDEFEENSII